VAITIDTIEGFPSPYLSTFTNSGKHRTAWRMYIFRLSIQQDS